MKRFLPKHFSYIGVSILVYLLFVLGSGVISYNWSKSRIIGEIDDKLFIAANSLKYMLAPDFHDRALSPDSISIEEEMLNRSRVSEFALNSGFAYLYTLVESNGRFFFSAPTVTEEEAAERERWYFYPYDDIPDGFRRAFNNKEKVYIDYSDQWGRFRSIALPQRSPGGHLYLSCADYEISYVKDLLIRITFKTILVSSAFIIPLIVFLFTFRRIYTDHYALIRQEMGGRKSLESQLRDLLDQMEVRVKERTSELKTSNDKLKQEIEERIRTQQALKESESRIRLVTDNLPVLIAFVDKELRYQFVNRKYEVWFKRPIKDFIGKRVDEVMTEEGFQTIKPYIHAALAGETVSYEGRMPTPDDGFRDFFSRNIPCRNEDGEVIGYFVLVEDITERKKVEESLKENEERYRTVVEESFDGIVLNDGERIVFANHRVEEMMGYESGELIGLEFKKLSTPGSYELMHQRAQMRMRGETPPSMYEVELVRKDGTTFEAEVSARRITLNNKFFIQTWVRDISEYKRAREAIDFERRQLLSIFNSLNEIIYVSDPFTHEILFANQRLRNLTGKNPAGELCYEYLQGRDKPCEFCTNQIILNNNGQPHRWEYRNPITNIDVAIVDQIIRWPDGRDVRLEIAVDITEKKKAEDSLRASENKLRSIFEAMSDVILILDANGRYLEIAPTSTNLLYLPSDELIGKTIADVFSSEKADEFLKVIGSALSLGKMVSLDYDLNIGNRNICFSATISPISSDQVILVARDITERKQAERALKEREEKFRLLADNLTDNIWIFDLEDLRFSYVSPSVINITGYTAEEATGFELSDTLTPPSLELATNLLEKELANDSNADPSRSVILELEQFHKNGSTVWTEASMSLIRDQEGHPKAVLGVTRDISERRKLQTQLQQAQKMETIGRLAGGIAHDFNNILQAILGYSELARQKAAAGKSILHELDVVIQAGTRATEVVNQILSFSRWNQPERKPLDMSLVVKEALKLLRASLPTTIEIRHEIVDTSDCILADPTQMHQVIMNLCTNAAHAMKESGGVLSVSLETVPIDEVLASKYPELNPGMYHSLCISDTGHGMDQETLARIFDPFFTTKEQGEGTGMGMSVVHGIIKNHQGAIVVYSEPGVGSTFQVYLPVLDIEGDIPQIVSESSVLVTGMERVLYVDDEELLVEVASDMLESLGYIVTSRTSGLEALELFKQDPHQFDLIITDQTMPRMTGIQLAKEVMKIRSDIPIILCTGYSAAITPIKVKAEGIRELVMKPLRIDQMARIIRDVLDQNSYQNQSAPPSKDMPTRSLRILLADDDPISRKIAVLYLEKANHSVVTVENGQEALALLDQEKFDLIVLDGDMPVMDGLQATTVIRAKEKETGNGPVPILAMTGHGADSDRKRFLEAGFNGFISKPIRFETLLQGIKDLANYSNKSQ